MEKVQMINVAKALNVRLDQNKEITLESERYSESTPIEKEKKKY